TSDENSAVDRTVPRSNHPFWIRGCVVGPKQCLAHVFRHRACDEQDVGMARRGHEAQPEALDIVECVVERMDFQLAAVAGPGIYPEDRKAPPEPAARGGVDARG